MKPKSKATLVLLLGVLCFAPVCGAERQSDHPTATISTNNTARLRTWTSTSGNTLRAEYVTTWDGYIQTEDKKGDRVTIRTEPTDGKVWIVLRTDAGKMFHVERIMLSSFDRQYLDLRDAGLYTPEHIHATDLESYRDIRIDALSFLIRSEKAKEDGINDFVDFTILDANKGNRYAQSLVGRSYMHRAESTSDREQEELYRNKGISALKDAAIQGDGLCQKMLGRIYTRGTHGVQRDPGEGKSWYTLAANVGDPEALAMLGIAEMDLNATLAADYFVRAGKGYLKQGDRERALMCVDRLKDVEADMFASQLKKLIYEKEDSGTNKAIDSDKK